MYYLLILSSLFLALTPEKINQFLKNKNPADKLSGIFAFILYKNLLRFNATRPASMTMSIPPVTNAAAPGSVMTPVDGFASP